MIVNHKLKSILELIKLTSNSRFLRTHQQSIVLSSMEKSGTNYLRLILTNYFFNYLSKGSENEQIEYNRMAEEIFPNVRKYVLDRKFSYQNPGINLNFDNGTMYKDFMYDHGCLLDAKSLPSFYRSKKIIFLYRNPFDIIVSRFFFWHKNRVGVKSSYEHPRDLISDFIPKYAIEYKCFKQFVKRHENAILISYEDLKLDTASTICRILHHLKIPIDMDVLQLAIEASSIEKVRKTEKAIGKAIHSPAKGMKGSFVRSGAVGGWKEYFNDDDVLKINKILSKNGINVNEFKN